jgi:hypothetical protein
LSTHVAGEGAVGGEICSLRRDPCSDNEAWRINIGEPGLSFKIQECSFADSGEEQQLRVVLNRFFPLKKLRVRMSTASVRQRNPKSDLTSKTTPTTSADEVPDEVEDASPVISVLDIIRIIFTLSVASCALSYYLTSGESVLWGYRPWLTRPQLLKAYFVSYARSYRALTSG